MGFANLSIDHRFANRVCCALYYMCIQINYAILNRSNNTTQNYCYIVLHITTYGGIVTSEQMNEWMNSHCIGANTMKHTLTHTPALTHKHTRTRTHWMEFQLSPISSHVRRLNLKPNSKWLTECSAGCTTHMCQLCSTIALFFTLVLRKASIWWESVGI